MALYCETLFPISRSFAWPYWASVEADSNNKVSNWSFLNIFVCRHVLSFRWFWFLIGIKKLLGIWEFKQKFNEIVDCRSTKPWFYTLTCDFSTFSIKNGVFIFFCFFNNNFCIVLVQTQLKHDALIIYSFKRIDDDGNHISAVQCT